MKSQEYRNDIQTLKQSALFDRAYYASKYGVSENQAAYHFAKNENRENSPSPVFSSQHYYKMYPDVRDAGVNALLHYIRFGQKEGRIYRSDNECELYDYYFTQTLFDMTYYAQTYMTPEERGTINPIEHYAQTGWKESNLPNPHFDLEAFFQKYPQCDSNPLLYCLKYRVPEIFIAESSAPVKLGYQEDVYRSYIHMLRQDAAMEQTYPNAASCEKLIWFWVTDQDSISGGLMSICGMYDISRRLTPLHGCEVVASTLPQSPQYLSGYSRFDNDMPVFRYEQIVYRFPNVKEVLIMLPENHIGQVYDYLFSHVDGYLARIPVRHLNILNQNIELMPANYEVDRLRRYFTKVTQTTAHKSYTTQYHRDLFGIPTHQIIPPIKKEIVFTPYDKKEELFIYSPDDHPCKAAILQRLRTEFPSMQFIEIRDIPFKEYLKLISRAKWAMSFGEGLDGYYLEPYSTGGVSFTAWNSEFFTEKYRNLPTILPSFEEAADLLPALMRSLDNPEAYEKARAQVNAVVSSDYASEKSPESTMENFFRGNYDFK